MSEKLNPTQQAAADEAESLDTMIPEYKLVKLGDKELPLKQIKVGKLPAFLMALRPVQHVLKTLYELHQSGKKIGFVQMTDLVMLYTDDMLNLLAVIMQVDRNWLDDQEIDDVVRVGVEFVGIHVDFFVEKVLPLLLVAARAAKDQKSQAPEASTTPEPSSN